MQLRGDARAWRMCGQGRRSTHHEDDFLVCPRPAKLDHKASCCVGKRLLLTRVHARSGGCFHPLTDSVLTETVEPDGRTPGSAIGGRSGRPGRAASLKKVLNPTRYVIRCLDSPSVRVPKRERPLGMIVVGVLSTTKTYTA